MSHQHITSLHKVSAILNSLFVSSCKFPRKYCTYSSYENFYNLNDSYRVLE